MSQYLGYLLLGLGSGGVAAALALGLVLTYRSSQVLNLATGAMALFAAYAYAFLRQGELFIPVPGPPTSVRLADSLPTAVALPVAIAMSALLSVLVYLLVFRPLRHARPVARGVASVGVMIVIQSALVIRVGTNPVVVDRIFPSGRWSVASTSVPKDRALLALTIVVVGVGLACADRFTRFGLATRAVAETEKGAIVVGLRPARVALANWAITGAVAGLAGILIAPIVPLVPVSYTALIVPALAAAALGRFVLIGPAVIGGLLIGMLQSTAVYLVGQHSWLPRAGLPELIPFVIVLVTLSVRGGPLPTRGMLIERSLGRSPRPKRILAPAVCGGVVAVAALYMTGHAYRGGLITSLILGVLGLSFVVITGYTGQVALAQWTLAGVSGFTLSGLTSNWGVPFPLAPLLAALLAAGVGTIAGIPAVRVRGLSFAVVTLALAVAVQGLVFANSSFNGGAGGAQVAKPTLFGLDLSAGVGRDFPRVEFGLVCLVVLVLAASSVALLRRSTLGIAMLTVRSNERAAAASGINVTAVKLLAFAISSFLAGLAGSLYAYHQSVVSSASFDLFVGLGLFAAVFLGGVTSVSGGICAGFLAAHGLGYVVMERAGATGRWYDLAGGIGLVIAVIAHPSGMAGTISGVWSSARRRRHVRSAHDTAAIEDAHDERGERRLAQPLRTGTF
jgi:branched-subunit amino acid ABC-type transport system permease component